MKYRPVWAGAPLAHTILPGTDGGDHEPIVRVTDPKSPDNVRVV